MNWVMRETLGIAMVVASVLLFWMLHPRGGPEVRLVRLPGMWIVLPLLIMVSFISGGALIYGTMAK